MLQAPGFGNCTAEWTHLAALQGCQKHPRTCPAHVNVAVQDHAMQNMTWQVALVWRTALMSCQPAGITASLALSQWEIYISGKRLHDSRATGGYRMDAACLLTLAMCHHPRSCCAFIPRLLLLLITQHHYCLPGDLHFPPSSSLAKLFVWQHLLLFPHLVLA